MQGNVVVVAVGLELGAMLNGLIELHIPVPLVPVEVVWQFLITLVVIDVGSVALYPLLGRKSLWARAVASVLGGVMGAALLAAPMLLIGAEQGLLRAIAVVVVVVQFAKVYDYRRNPDRLKRPGIVHYAAFIVLPNTLLFEQSHRRATDPLGPWLKRILLGIVELGAGVGALLWLGPRIGYGTWLPLEHVLRLFPAALIIQGGSRILVGATRLAGLQSRALIDDVFLCRSVADFWRRYNTFVGGWLHRHVFEAAGGRRAPIRAVVLTFIVSAAMHEYLLTCATGRVQGLQTAFFLLQIPGVLAPGMLAQWRRRRRRALAFVPTTAAAGGTDGDSATVAAGTVVDTAKGGRPSALWVVGRVAAHGGTILYMAATMMLFFLSVDEILPFYWGSW